MEVGGLVVVTFFKVILKFGYDQIGISYRNELLKNVKSQSNMSNTLYVTELCFTTWGVQTWGGETGLVY